MAQCYRGADLEQDQPDLDVCYRQGNSQPMQLYPLTSRIDISTKVHAFSFYWLILQVHLICRAGLKSLYPTVKTQDQAFIWGLRVQGQKYHLRGLFQQRQEVGVLTCSSFSLAFRM